ncbi:hypothetical protein AB0392_04155 [Nonomuraea angiospora]|uniref:hypothetical protein n=1 Tax=Nonomuraea angiospora TaxID=46172 RepID=UPI00344D589D
MISQTSKSPYGGKLKGRANNQQKPHKAIALIFIVFLIAAALVYVDLQHARDARLQGLHSTQGDLSNAA